MTKMQHVSDWIRDHLLECLRAPLDLDALRREARKQVDPQFELLRERYLLMGYLRYGSLGCNPTSLSRAEAALRKYRATHNRECLIDAANFCALEWKHPTIEGAHYTPSDRNE